MNDPNLPLAILKQFLIQMPVILVCAAGLITAVSFRHKAPGASLWTAGAFALALLICGHVIMLSVAESGGWSLRADFTRSFLVPALRAVSYALLLVGVYAGRTNPTTTPAVAAQSIWQPVIEAIRARPGLKRVFLTVFMAVFLLIALVNTLATLAWPESFLSIARIRLTSDLGGRPDARQIKTECEVIQSEVILGRVIDQLDLNTLWGKAYGDAKLKTSESMQLLKARIDVRPVDNANLIEIRCYSERPSDAALLANALAEIYASYRLQNYQRTDLADDLKLGLPKRDLGEIVDRAIPTLKPSRPNKSLNIVLGLWTGLWVAFVMAGGVTWMGYRAGKPQLVSPVSQPPP